MDETTYYEQHAEPEDMRSDDCRDYDSISAIIEQIDTEYEDDDALLDAATHDAARIVCGLEDRQVAA